MNDPKLERYWLDIPVGKENAVSYGYLILKWKRCEREVRKILHQLSLYDNGDEFILVRSGKGKGFYRTNETETIKAYRQECLNKGRSVFAPIKKINRVLNKDDMQITLEDFFDFL